MTRLSEVGGDTIAGFGDDPVWVSILKTVLIFVVLVLLTLFNIWAERRVVARMQHRIGPNGITAQVRNDGITMITGAIRNTTLSAALGMMSSFSASFTPSARLCRRPNGPFTFGPIRCCIRATTRRSHQMLNRVRSTSTRKIRTALRITTHTGS